MYHEVVIWMLKRDMLITLHLRIRIVATVELKRRVKEQHRESKIVQKLGKINPSGRMQADSVRDAQSSNGSPRNPFHLVRNPLRFARRISSNESGHSEISELNFQEEDIIDRPDYPGESANSNSELDEEDSGWDTTEDHLGPSMINDPGKATPMQRRWLSAMSEGIEPAVAKRFERYVAPYDSWVRGLTRGFSSINQYFDGKRSDDEILYRADISRRQLREVLHHYDEYVSIFLMFITTDFNLTYFLSCKLSCTHLNDNKFSSDREKEFYFPFVCTSLLGLCFPLLTCLYAASLAMLQPWSNQITLDSPKGSP
jgi:hypothetical protein